MVMKTFIFATCAALFAGGVVYFGTDTAETGGSGHIESVELAGEKSGSKDIISRYIGPGDSEPEAEPLGEDNPYVLEASADHPHPPNKPDRDLVEPESEIEIVEAEPEFEPETEHFERKAEIIEPEPELNTEPEAKIETVTTVTTVETVETEVVETPPARLERLDRQNERSSRKEKRKNRLKQRSKEVDRVSDDPAQQRINAVFAEAEKIGQSDLRDRAYLDLTDYATSKGMFGEAEKAALKIQQVELRDTARSRIAMGLARFGKSDEAFELIEEVEIEELRDVMRLQVIEALLGTDGRR